MAVTKRALMREDGENIYEIYRKIDQIRKRMKALNKEIGKTRSFQRKVAIRKELAGLWKEQQEYDAKVLQLLKGKATGITFKRYTPDLHTGITRLDLVGGADSGTTTRSEKVTSRLAELKSHNILVYQSYTVRERTWLQIIQLNLQPKMEMFSIKKAIEGDMYVHCTCPAFKWWGFQYLCTSRRIIVPGRENPIFPKIRNPWLVGTVCKHLVQVLTQMPQDAKQIYKFLMQKSVHDADYGKPFSP